MMTFLCGQGPAAEAILLQLLKRKHRSLAVFTHDPANGISSLAHKAGVPCTIKSVNDRSIWPWAPSLIISVGYLYIIKPEVIEQVDGQIVNCHYALLPRHRGRSPVPWAILEGDQMTGITWHWIDEGIDTGRILLQAACQIDKNETQTTLFAKLHQLASETFDGALTCAMSGVAGIPQRGTASYHYAGPPHGGQIDPSWTDETVERMIRAMTYPPLFYATWHGREVRTFDEWKAIAHA